MTKGHHDTTCPRCVSLQLEAVASDFPSSHDHPGWNTVHPSEKRTGPEKPKAWSHTVVRAGKAPAQIHLAPTLAIPHHMASCTAGWAHSADCLCAGRALGHKGSPSPSHLSEELPGGLSSLSRMASSQNVVILFHLFKKSC